MNKPVLISISRIMWMALSPPPWDPSDDLPLEQLVATACEGKTVVHAVMTCCRFEYSALQPQPPPPSAVAALLLRIGVRPASLASRYERAMRRDGSSLRFEDFLVALLAMDPTTRRQRMERSARPVIFRAYDVDDGVLEPELARLLADVRLAYGTPPLPYDELSPRLPPRNAPVRRGGRCGRQ